MASERYRNDERLEFWPNPRDAGFGPSSASRTYSMRNSYWSNRESGQVVKRESPWFFSFAQLIRCKPGTRVDVVNWSPHYQSDVWSPSGSRVYARAYASFKKQAEMPSAELLLNAVEGRKSLEMIAARAFQLRELLNALRKGRLGDAWLYMTLNPDQSLLGLKNGRRRDSRFVSGKERQASMDEARRIRQLVKDIGSIFLEFRYGWSPLMADIKSACEVLSKPIPDKLIRASAVETYGERGTDDVGAPLTSNVSEKVTIKGRIRVTNPNLDLANRLGLINPASVAWEAVPFSFVVDWFLPVGDFLRSYTDFAGIELIDGSITGTRTWFVQSVGGWVDIPGGDRKVEQDRMSARGKVVKRSVGISSLPKPPLIAGAGLTVGRALNAIALLAQGVDPKKAARIRGGVA